MLIIIALVIAGAWYWWQIPYYVNEGIAFVASEKVKRTMYHFGYKRDYRVLPSGKLQVKLNGTWQKLRYRKENCYENIRRLF